MKSVKKDIKLMGDHEIIQSWLYRITLSSEIANDIFSVMLREFRSPRMIAHIMKELSPTPNSIIEIDNERIRS